MMGLTKEERRRPYRLHHKFADYFSQEPDAGRFILLCDMKEVSLPPTLDHLFQSDSQFRGAFIKFLNDRAEALYATCLDVVKDKIEEV